MKHETYSADALAPYTGKTYTVHVITSAYEHVTDPSSTKRVIRGPQAIILRRWADGGLDATIDADLVDGVEWVRPGTLAAPIDTNR